MKILGFDKEKGIVDLQREDGVKLSISDKSMETFEEKEIELDLGGVYTGYGYYCFNANPKYHFCKRRKYDWKDLEIMNDALRKIMGKDK
jgi:hypothetical protein